LIKSDAGNEVNLLNLKSLWSYTSIKDYFNFIPSIIQLAFNKLLEKFLSLLTVLIG
jgi:hypothetical protein